MQKGNLIIFIFLQVGTFFQSNVAHIVSIPLDSMRILGNSEHSSVLTLAKNMDMTFGDIGNINNSVYTLKLQIGEKKEQFNLVMDTGSNLTWIATSLCSSKVFTSYYYCEINDGCIVSNPPLTQSVKHDLGFVSGNLGEVKISLGNLSTVSEEILLVDSAKDYPSDLLFHYNGLLGLGPKNVLSIGGSTWIQNYFKQNIISTPEFSVYLSLGESKSELSLGGINEKYQDSNASIGYHPVQQDSEQWEIALKEFKIGTYYQTSEDFTGKVVIDTEFSFIGTEKKIWIEIAKTLETITHVQFINSNFMAVSSCSSIDFPDIVFSLPDEEGNLIEYSLEPEFYLEKLDHDKCFLPFQKINTAEGISFTLGQQFLHKYIASFSYSPLRVGISRSINKISNSKNDDPSALSALFIFLVVIGSLISTSLILYGIYFLWRKKQNKKNLNSKYIKMKDKLYPEYI